MYGFRKNIKAITYLNFPLCTLLLIIAKPLIELLYGSKWDPAVPYFQLLCISGMLYSMNSLNGSVVKALGKGKVYFTLTFTQRAIGLVLMFLGIRYSVKGLLIAVITSEFINYFLFSIANGRLLGYGLWLQLKDVFFCLIISVFVGVVVFYCGKMMSMHPYLVMVIQVIIYVCLFAGISALFKIEGYYTYKDVVKQLINHR